MGLSLLLLLIGYAKATFEFCGNDICEGTETCSSCPADCGICPSPTPTATCNPILYFMDANGDNIIDTANASWYGWFNTDSPSGNGDYETIGYVNGRYAYSAQSTLNFCTYPLDVYCATADAAETPWYNTSMNIVFDKHWGCMCVNSMNGNNCLDFKAKYLCPPAEYPGYMGCNPPANYIPAIPSASPSISITPSWSSSTTMSSSETMSFTSSGTLTPSGSTTSSGTVSGSGTASDSGTASGSGTVTASGTSSGSGTVTSSGTVTISGTVSGSGTATISGTASGSGTATISGTASGSGTVTASGTASGSGTVTASGTSSASGTSTISGTSSDSTSSIPSGTLTNTITPTESYTSTSTISPIHNSTLEYVYNDLNLLNMQNQESASLVQNRILLGTSLGGFGILIVVVPVAVYLYKRKNKNKKSINIVSNRTENKSPIDASNEDLETVDLEIGVFNYTSDNINSTHITINNLQRAKMGTVPHLKKDDITRLTGQGKNKGDHLTTCSGQLQYANEIKIKNKVVPLNLEYLEQYKTQTDNTAVTTQSCSKQLQDQTSTETQKLDHNTLIQIGEVVYSPLNLIYRDIHKNNESETKSLQLRYVDGVKLVHSPLNLIYQEQYKTKNNNFEFACKIKKVRRPISNSPDLVTKNKEKLVYSPIKRKYWKPTSTQLYSAES